MIHPSPLFRLFCSFQTNLQKQIYRLSGIQTRIVGVEGRHDDHLTTTTLQKNSLHKVTMH